MGVLQSDLPQIPESLQWACDSSPKALSMPPRWQPPWRRTSPCQGPEELQKKQGEMVFLKKNVQGWLKAGHSVAQRLTYGGLTVVRDVPLGCGT